MSGELPPSSPSPDVVPGLAATLERCGLVIGETVNHLVREAFTEGVRNGMEIAALICEANILALTPEYASYAECIGHLRDQIRLQSLAVEVPQ
jgi:hypothetical protein